MRSLMQSGRFVIILVTIVVMVLLVLGLNNRIVELRHLSEEAAEYEAELLALQYTKIVLETQLAYATSEAPVIQWAMEDARMIRDDTGEQLIVVLEDPDATPPPISEENDQVEIQPAEKWQVWMALFFDDQELP